MAEINKISSFKSFTEIRKQENANKLREENNLKRQEAVGKIATILDELGLTSFEGLEEDQKETIISKIFGDVSEEELAEIEVEVEKEVEETEESEEQVSEALDIRYKRDAKKVVTQFKKIFAELGSLTADKVTYLGAIKYLYNEALTDANFHSARSATEKIIKGRLNSISVSPESLGKHAIIVGAKNIMKILDEYYSRISNAAGWSGPGIAEGTAMYLESIGEGSTAEKLLVGFNAANESVEYQLSEEEISLKESNLIFEATVTMDAMNPKDKDFLKFLKKNSVKIIDMVKSGPTGHPEITMQGKREDLEAVLADGELGWDDAGLADYIEESATIVLNEGTRGQFGKIDRKGNITSVYTHYDSYPENMLPIIKSTFKSGKNVDFVLKNGDNSGLDKDIKKINFYGGDSNLMTGNIKSINDYIKNANYEAGAEFIYLWDEKSKKWMMADIYAETGLVPAFESVVNESEAENILQDLLDERGGDIGELHGMEMEDALDTVETYGHKGSKAEKIAKELVSLCNESVSTESTN
jgi:hypothetical protein